MTEFDLAALAAKDDEQKFAELVESSRGWVLRCASETTHRYVTDSDDAWSVALLAFHEAVQSYDGDKGSFRGFAAMVIRRRLTDQLRADGRHGEVAVSPDAFGGDPSEDTLDHQVQRQVAADSMREDVGALARAEIAEMQVILKQYGFSFFDLAESSPKTEKTKKSCFRAIRCLIASVILLAKMRRKRALPSKELSAESGVVRKIMERHRRYIIASAEILDGDFPVLASYLEGVRKEETE